MLERVSGACSPVNGCRCGRGACLDQVGLSVGRGLVTAEAEAPAVERSAALECMAAAHSAAHSDAAGQPRVQVIRAGRLHHRPARVAGSFGPRRKPSPSTGPRRQHGECLVCTRIRALETRHALAASPASQPGQCVCRCRRRWAHLQAVCTRDAWAVSRFRLPVVPTHCICQDIWAALLGTVCKQPRTCVQMPHTT